MLCCTVLYSTVLHCAVLYSSALFCTLKHSALCPLQCSTVPYVMYTVQSCSTGMLASAASTCVSSATSTISSTLSTVSQSYRGAPSTVTSHQSHFSTPFLLLLCSQPCWPLPHGQDLLKHSQRNDGYIYRWFQTKCRHENEIYNSENDFITQANMVQVAFTFC